MANKATAMGGVIQPCRVAYAMEPNGRGIYNTIMGSASRQGQAAVDPAAYHHSDDHVRHEQSQHHPHLYMCAR